MYICIVTILLQRVLNTNEAVDEEERPPLQWWWCDIGGGGGENEQKTYVWY